MEVLDRDIAALKRAIQIQNELSGIHGATALLEESKQVKPPRTKERMQQREAAIAAYLKAHGEVHITELGKHLDLNPVSLHDWLEQFMKREGERSLWTTGTTKSHFKLKPTI